MSDCCSEALSGGRPAGGASSPAIPSTLFAVTVDLDVTSVFPVATDIVQVTVPANRLGNDGDMLRARFGGWYSTVGPAVVCFPALVLNGLEWWAAQSPPVPIDAAIYPWSLDVLVTRKTVATYAGIAVAMAVPFSSAFVGRGDFAGNNNGGPVVTVEPDPAIDWTLAQSFVVRCSWNAAGGTFRIKSGYVEVVEAP